MKPALRLQIAYRHRKKQPGKRYPQRYVGGLSLIHPVGLAWRSVSGPLSFSRDLGHLKLRSNRLFSYLRHAFVRSIT